MLYAVSVDSGCVPTRFRIAVNLSIFQPRISELTVPMAALSTATMLFKSFSTSPSGGRDAHEGLIDAELAKWSTAGNPPQPASIVGDAS